MHPDFSRKQVVFIIRLMVIIVTAYVIVFTPGANLHRHWGYGFIAFYLFTNLVVAYLPQRFFDQEPIFYVFVLFDTLMVAAGIYLAGMVGTDFYLVYFLVICLASMGARFRYLMINVVLFAGVYGWLLHEKGYLAGDLAVSYFLRLPFIVIIAMFYGFIGTIMLRERQQQEHETRERYGQLFNSSDVYVYTVDLFGDFLSANPKLYQAYGYDSEKAMLGLSFSQFHGPGESAEFQEHVDAVFSGGRPVQYESYDGRLKQWLSHTLSPLYDRQGNRVFAVAVVSKDITERVRKEEELKKAYDKLRETRDQLIQKDKMAALGRLASGVAHEIRNPLEIISMGVDYLENFIPRDQAAAAGSLEKIHRAIDRANTIINDVLKFSRKSEMVIEPVDIRRAAEESLSLCGYIIRKTGVQVLPQFPEDPVTVAGNRNMLIQVLINLVHNAVDAMAGSEVKELKMRIYTDTVTEVGYKTGYRRADYFKIGEEMAVVEISDTGAGIDPDVLPKIFEPFFTTKQAGGGTGLGLSLAHMIMERMMGTIDVSSRAGRGATFFVKLQPGTKIDMIREVQDEQRENKGPGDR